MSEAAIHVKNLYRYFGALKAVDGISFEVPHGSVCGFVGSNGAGKTTTMRVLATLDHPTMGSAEICGINVMHHPAEVRSLIGWMPDHFGNYENMTVIEYLDFYARALGYKGAERRRRIEDVMGFTDLTPLADRLSNKMSKGMTQRLGLGRALIHDPQVLIMDEPAAGLDPKARVELKHLIRVLAEDGKTIFISSHILSELGEMCDRLLFLDNGRIVHYGDAESLKEGSHDGLGSLYTVHINDDPQKISDWAILQPQVEFIDRTKNGARIKIESENKDDIAATLRKMITEGLSVTEFRREERNLEDAFVDIIGKLNKGDKSPIKTPPIRSSAPPPLPLEEPNEDADKKNFTTVNTDNPQ